MTVSPHPEFAAEQAYVTSAYEMLDRGLADAERSFEEVSTPHRSTAQAMRRALEILRNSRGSGQLVFGRLDVDGERRYIGRRRVYTPDRDLLVIGWHAPAAQPFYEATPQDPRGVELKRVFVEEDRILRRIIDEIVGASAGQIAEPVPHRR